MKKCNACDEKFPLAVMNAKYGPNGTLFCEECYYSEDLKEIILDIQKENIIKKKKRRQNGVLKRFLKIVQYRVVKC